MKNINMLKIKILTLLGLAKKALLVFLVGGMTVSCSDFLDVVPDNVFQYDDLFTSRRTALYAMSKIYRNVPRDHEGSNIYSLGDEWISGLPSPNDSNAQRTMRGLMSSSNVLLNYWGDRSNSVYARIQDCDLLIQYIDRVPDMTLEEKNDWKGQALFMKGYNAFMLLQQWGPIILPKITTPDSPDEDIFMPRSTVDECFDYILEAIDEAIPLLKERAAINDLGMADKVTAKSIKAQILLYRASQFYNGNTDYAYFKTADGRHFFPQTEDPEKWKAVIDAVDEALASCEKNRLGLYRYRGQPYEYDVDDYEANETNMSTLYNQRLKIVDNWNEGIIWGFIYSSAFSSTYTYNSTILKPASYGGPGPANSGTGWLGASYQVMERYYTAHGLPIDEDVTFNRNRLTEIVRTPDETDTAYIPLQGIMQPGVQTIRMYLDREPRFYADFGITGGYYRAHQVRINTMMFEGSDGGYNSSVQQYPNLTGIAIQKFSHPETYSGSVTWYAFPIIRVANLYLMRAEALNEYYGPSQEVYDALNAIRLRAGIPPVEESYSNLDWVTTEAFNKHLNKDGLRDIILRERAIELSFEGFHFFDMIRHKRAVSEFSKPIMGWNYQANTAVTFFDLQIAQERSWSMTRNLWPVPLSEMNANKKLIQNPGW